MRFRCVGKEILEAVCLSLPAYCLHLRRRIGDGSGNSAAATGHHLGDLVFLSAVLGSCNRQHGDDWYAGGGGCCDLRCGDQYGAKRIQAEKLAPGSGFVGVFSSCELMLIVRIIFMKSRGSRVLV